jgi:carboxyl-terminal processing protease
MTFTRSLITSTVLAMTLGVVDTTPAIQAPAQDSRSSPVTSLSVGDRIKAFDKVWIIIDEDFYDPGFNGADWTSAYSRYRSRIEAAKDDDEFYDLISEMLSELRDSHTTFHRPPVYSGKKHDGSKVGVSVFPVEGRLTVIDVDSSSEAAKAGVKAGMFVTTFAGAPAQIRLEELRKSISKSAGIATDRMLTVLVSSLFFTGELNTAVLVGFESEAVAKLEVSLTRRANDNPPTMTARQLDSGFGYIRFNAWVPPNDKRFREEVRKLLTAPGMIIDLRGNRGGSFMTADYFFQPGTLAATTVWRSGKTERGFTGKSDVNYEGKLIVLVDEESGSASENFAALIQESGRGLIVGRQSCGCLTSSYFESVKGGGRLQWSRVLVRTVKGNKIEGRGVTPDKVVPLTLSDLGQGRDAVLEEAERTLQAQLSRTN